MSIVAVRVFPLYSNHFWWMHDEIIILYIFPDLYCNIKNDKQIIGMN